MNIGPFDLELVNVTHSIPESNAVAIRTPAGTAFHTGDWKLDPTPLIGAPTDEARIREIGAEGVDALICDSTNAFRGGVSPSEADVAETLTELIASAKQRVAVTTFASNVARMRSVITAADAAERSVVIVGRAMHRVTQIARETGYLDEKIPLLSEDEYNDLPADRVVALCTGSQGEPRGAMARIARNEHPRVKFASGDRVIFSSRPIPGNDKAIITVQNNLADLGVEIITDAEALIHVSGHPRREELLQMYDWTRPRAAVPMHGEPRHLHEHAALARGQGVAEVVPARNGSLVRLAPGPAEIVDHVPVGRLHRDGLLYVDAEADSIRERRKLSFVGSASLVVRLSADGDLLAPPEVNLFGLPPEEETGVDLEEVARKAAVGALDGIPRPRRRDEGKTREAIRRGVRAGLGRVWGKRPLCAIFIVRD